MPIRKCNHLLNNSSQLVTRKRTKISGVEFWLKTHINTSCSVLTLISSGYIITIKEVGNPTDDSLYTVPNSSAKRIQAIQENATQPNTGV
jgi:hypothetical protein